MSGTSDAPGTATVKPGDTFAGKYVVQRVIGSGGMGIVLAAEHPQLGQTVAIKILGSSVATQSGFAARFLREARAVARLRNEHIARVMDADTDDHGRQFIVMEYLSGSDLRDVHTRKPTGPIPDAVGYVLHACEALAEAHAAGIIHRDLKLENLFLTKGADGSPSIKVLDFGISKILPVGPQSDAINTSVVTGRHEFLGSPAYMPPERLRTPELADVGTDIWALGVILYELLTGRRPFTSPTFIDLIAEVMVKTPKAPHDLRAAIPEKLGAVVLRCLEKKPENRFPNVGELARALYEWTPIWARESAVRAARTAGLAPPPRLTPALGFTPPPADGASPTRIEAPSSPGAASAGARHPQGAGTTPAEAAADPGARHPGHAEDVAQGGGARHPAREAGGRRAGAILGGIVGVVVLAVLVGRGLRRSPAPEVRPSLAPPAVERTATIPTPPPVSLPLPSPDVAPPHPDRSEPDDREQHPARAKGVREAATPAPRRRAGPGRADGHPSGSGSGRAKTPAAVTGEAPRDPLDGRR